ncbi:hypothetical protein OGAPHI_007310 [Ogataea philodendri]|uniref:Uncharacterized protein n=1 Tax=Ogataea philodendri TaxID=1378263 RepID=A0A9P8NUT4_9ASCO|nr:uncharacterized protein OGAPHI_007310 [Ogataea philodendri]KAH3660105.1 hypothetical protein OGAPHI_007310 [Ogataea philodendri]
MSSAASKPQAKQPWAAAIAPKPSQKPAKQPPKSQSGSYVPVNNFNGSQVQAALAAKFKQIKAQLGPGAVYHGGDSWAMKQKKRKELDVLAELSKTAE